MNLDQIDIDGIVQSVLQQLQRRDDRPLVSAIKPVSQPKLKSAALIQSAVVTADLLAEKVGTNKSIRISPKAIITPAARDYLREKNITVESLDSATTQNQTVKSETTQNGWHGLVVSASETLNSCLQNLEKSSNGRWSQELSDSTSAAVKLARQEVARGNKRGYIIFTDKAATACCEVNRSEQVRGVVISRAADLPAIAEVKANVICLPASGLSFMEYRQIFHHLMTENTL
ncbi:hypothetical protein [Rubinisphaera sp.]|uniref:hypothetical protein n=1 Tax=Rubinisphaera sp. TaxID=2024857 RepID=UPI000C0DF2AA|nr:hypothetical protein [Rubinisphaera sp.]MBV09325.1 hypothetical protein [Rubinisphaera sp.]|tara:strand:- start:1112 stop:1804 length:693 start_codon:yes stop_codon:yes gene_type:complete